MRNRLWMAGLAAVLACLVSGTWAAEATPQATGLLVKFKDSGSATQSVVRLAATQRAADGGAAHARRLAALLSRDAIPNRGHHATAFAAHVVRFDQARSTDEARQLAARLRQNPDVEWVAVDEVLLPAAVTKVSAVSVAGNDFAYRQQTWLQPRQVNDTRAGLIDAPAAWRRLQGRLLTPVTVAVLDSGVLPATDLEGRMWPGRDFVSTTALARDGDGLDSDPTDPGTWLTQAERDANPQVYGADCKVGDSEWHGLSVTYMLAAASDNGLMGAGLLAPLPGKVVLPVRVAGACGASLSDLIEGMLWSAGLSYQGSPAPNPNPARVINVSFGGAGSCAETQPGSVGWLLQRTVDALGANGVLVVAAAGNGDASGVGMPQPTRPANCIGVMAVTGLDVRGYKAGYANLIDVETRLGAQFGVAVDTGNTTQTFQGTVLVSDDDGITSLTNKGTREALPGDMGLELSDTLVGTSFGAPQVAGVAALMLAVAPNLSRDDLLLGLQASVRGFPTVASASTGITFPTCDADHTSYCNCTRKTCGAGILDAGMAVDWALSHATGAPAPALSPADTSYFTPSRGNTAGSMKTSGGAGAMGWGEVLAGLAGLLVLSRHGRGRQDRQAMKPLS